MNKRKNALFVLLIILLLSLLIFIGLFFYLRFEGKLAFAPADTEVEITELETEPIIIKPLSYVDQCALDYVELPVKRTREEAVAKIKEQ